jgi:peptide/nickel transport system permease protein
MSPIRAYALRRTGQGLAMYVALVLSLSAVFNSAADGNLRARIEEETLAVMRSAGSLDEAAAGDLKRTTSAELTRRYGLDEPWAGRVAHRAVDDLLFRFGRAGTLRSADGDPSVVGLVLGALPNTILLFGIEAILVMGLGLVMGLLAARRPRGLLDRFLTALPPFLNGIPSWWMAMLALSAFAYAIPLFPSGGLHANPPPTGLRGLADLLWHLALPLLVLVGLNLWGFALQARTLLGGMVDAPWLRSARARGIPERRILFVHVLAGVRAPLLTVFVLGLLQSLSGNLLIEGIFGWPGLGNLYFAAAQQSDVPVLLGILSFQTLINLAGLVGLDIAYRVLDPRAASRDAAGRTR